VLFDVNLKPQGAWTMIESHRERHNVTLRE